MKTAEAIIKEIFNRHKVPDYVVNACTLVDLFKEAMHEFASQSKEETSKEYFSQSSHRSALSGESKEESPRWVKAEEPPNDGRRVWIALDSEGEQQYTVDRYLGDHWRVEELVPGVKVIAWMEILKLDESKSEITEPPEESSGLTY